VNLRPAGGASLVFRTAYLGSPSNKISWKFSFLEFRILPPLPTKSTNYAKINAGVLALLIFLAVGHVSDVLKAMFWVLAAARHVRAGHRTDSDTWNVLHSLPWKNELGPCLSAYSY
jgi:hypothetical protein